MDVCNYSYNHKINKMALTGRESACNYEFVTEPDDALKCLICIEVAEDPWQHGKCGRLFCERCLESYGKTKACPNCRAAKPNYFEDNRSKREIRSLRIRCANVSGRCEWEGTIGTRAEHAQVCRSLPCPNQCTDQKENTKHILRQNLARHLERDCPNRDYTCKHCGKRDTYIRITQIHDKACKRKVVSCPNTKCTEMMERGETVDHVENHCGYTIISCKYQDIGCEVKLKRQDMVHHELEDDKNHLHMALDNITLLKNTVASLEEKHNTLKPGESILLKLTDFQIKKERNEKSQFPPFYTHRNGYLMVVQVYANGFGYSKGTHISVYARVMEGKYNNELSWPFNGTVTVKLLNQLTDDHHHTRAIKSSAQVHEVDSAGGTLPRGCAKYISHSELDSGRNAQYLMNDVLYFRVSCEVPSRKLWLE